MRRIGIIIAASAALLVAGVVWHVRSDGSEVDFNRDVRPIFNENCVVCHGGVKREAELSLLFRSDALEPAESGRHAIVPGRPGKSELIRRVAHSDPEERMPLDQPPLTSEEIGVLKKWIDAGAPWEPHWAYVAPSGGDLPEVENEQWPKNGIDRFVLARLEERELSPSPRAECAVLLRRASLDLVGLPPTPEDAEDFCGDPTQERFEAAVDALLASERFGERWAAYWLDLARYADSNGYEKDEPRSIWKYRDWVIRAFNEDVPFDQFSIEQLAADLLPDATGEDLVATAFHRNTMTNTEGGTDDEEFRTAAVIDRLNTTFEIWQGTTISCAQCHGHPYDPFRHEEFYELLAFFNNTADEDRPDNEPNLVQFELDADRGRQLLDAAAGLEAEMDAAVNDDSLAAWTGRLEAYARDGDRAPRFEGRTVGPHIIRIARRDRSERSPRDRALLRELFIRVRPEFEAIRQKRSKLTGAVAALEPVTTPIIRELPPDEARWTHVFERGNWLARAERVKPGVPRSLPGFPGDASRDRLGLAQWLFSPENPLTARVTVNRFWEQLFGTGIVETVEDFGTQGERPSHPELLDWLALSFSRDLDWSVKRLLKEIVTSATYQQSARAEPELFEIDPYNRLLARGPRFRLSGEQIRDQALAVSGLLSDKMFGPSVFPPQPPGLWTNPYSSLTWKTSEGEDRYRRAVYTFWRRTVPYPSLLAFDAPSREVCVSRRIRTNTPLQSLVTLNDPVYVEAAAALAQRMQDGSEASVEEMLRRGYRLALQRDPPEETIARLLELYRKALAEFESRPDDAWYLLNIKEFAFSDYEELEIEGYNAGPAASGAAPEPTPRPEAPESAALAVAANALLNLDAFLTKE